MAPTLRRPACQPANIGLLESSIDPYNTDDRIFGWPRHHLPTSISVNRLQIVTGGLESETQDLPRQTDMQPLHDHEESTSRFLFRSDGFFIHV